MGSCAASERTISGERQASVNALLSLQNEPPGKSVALEALRLGSIGRGPELMVTGDPSIGVPDGVTAEPTMG